MKHGIAVLLFFVIIGTLGRAVSSHAGMASSSFHIPTSVISSGGISMGSANFKANSTLGQPSPIKEILSSTSFKIDSGFWNTIYYASILSGDINNDGVINLTDAILALKIMSNIASPVSVFKQADINNDGRIGLEEALQALQVTSGLKSQP